MRISAARLRPYRLRLRKTLETAHQRFDERRGVLLELEAEDGTTGFGDACPLLGFGMEDLGRAEDVLARCAAELPGRELGGDDDAWLERLDAIDPAAPCARGALDTALIDLAARAKGSSFAARLSGTADEVHRRTSLPSSTLITGDGLEDLATGAREAAAAGFTTFKLKLGVGSMHDDRARVAALRQAIGPDARLRVDANGAWSERIAAAALGWLADLGVELIEQPVAADRIDALARLRAMGRLPIAADESASSPAGALRVLEAGAADVIVLKPAALGGPTRALALARSARARGCAVFVTTLLDSAIGVAAAAQLASLLPGPRPADGLATSALFVRDLAPAPAIVSGSLTLPPGPGLGVQPDAVTLEALQCGPTRTWHA